MVRIDVLPGSGSRDSTHLGRRRVLSQECRRAFFGLGHDSALFHHREESQDESWIYAI